MFRTTILSSWSSSPSSCSSDSEDDEPMYDHPNLPDDSESSKLRFMHLSRLPNAFARRIPTLRYLSFHLVHSSWLLSAPHTAPRTSKSWRITRSEMLDTDAPTTCIKELSQVQGQEVEERLLALDKNALIVFDIDRAIVWRRQRRATLRPLRTNSYAANNRAAISEVAFNVFHSQTRRARNVFRAPN